MKIYYMEQGTQEWHDIRDGKLTASNAKTISVNGVGLKTYTTSIVADIFSYAERLVISNDHIERGHELEPEARTIYELENQIEVTEVGFIELDSEVGCSPDGLVGEDGGLEIKSPGDKIYTGLILGDSIDLEYWWQMQMNMYITDRKWWDFVAYNPNFQKNVFIKRIERNDASIEKLKVGLESGRTMLKEKIEKMKKFLEQPQ